MTNLERLKADLKSLIDQGRLMHFSLLAKHHPETKKSLSAEEREKLAKAPDLKDAYQSWYSEALAVIRQLLPDRLGDFVKLYEAPKGRKVLDITTYRIEDAVYGLEQKDRNGETILGRATVLNYLDQQVNILQACEQRFESSLFDMRSIVRADLFDSELDSCRELLKHGFGRAAGAICGVILEKHLAVVAASHSIKITKKHPTLADLNDPLKEGGVYDVPTWRGFQRLADIRNLCSHNKGREPTDEEVRELLDGVDKATKTIF